MSSQNEYKELPTSESPRLLPGNAKMNRVCSSIFVIVFQFLLVSTFIILLFTISSLWRGNPLFVSKEYITEVNQKSEKWCYTTAYSRCDLFNLNMIYNYRKNLFYNDLYCKEVCSNTSTCIEACENAWSNRYFLELYKIHLNIFFFLVIIFFSIFLLWPLSLYLYDNCKREREIPDSPDIESLDFVELP